MLHFSLPKSGRFGEICRFATTILVHMDLIILCLPPMHLDMLATSSGSVLNPFPCHFLNLRASYGRKCRCSPTALMRLHQPSSSTDIRFVAVWERLQSNLRLSGDCTICSPPRFRTLMWTWTIFATP